MRVVRVRAAVLRAGLRGTEQSDPRLVYLNSEEHGYNLVEVTPEAFTCSMRAVSTVKQAEASVRTVKALRVPRDRVGGARTGPRRRCQWGDPCVAPRQGTAAPRPGWGEMAERLFES